MRIVRVPERVCDAEGGAALSHGKAGKLCVGKRRSPGVSPNKRASNGAGAAENSEQECEVQEGQDTRSCVDTWSVQWRTEKFALFCKLIGKPVFLHA